VRLGVRPEKLRLVVGEADGANADANLNCLTGSVLDASYVGVSTQYVVDIGAGHEVVVYSQNVEISGLGEQLSPGQRVQLTWKPQHTFVIPRRGESPVEEE
jgi:spermidine/putrescine transport system ATP-binding protein